MKARDQSQVQFFRCPPPWFYWDEVSHWGLKQFGLGWLAREPQGSSCLPSPALGRWDDHVSCFLCEFWGLNSSNWACATSRVLSSPSPHSQIQDVPTLPKNFFRPITVDWAPVLSGSFYYRPALMVGRLRRNQSQNILSRFFGWT